MQDNPDLEPSDDIREQPAVKITAQSREELSREPQGNAEPPNETNPIEIPDRDEEKPLLLDTGKHGGMVHDEIFEEDINHNDA